MNVDHKSKVMSSLLSALVGALGVHRFYLHGRKDILGWIYFSASIVYLAILAVFWLKASLVTSVAILFPIPAFIAAIEALAIGLIDDAKWDQRHNAHSLTRSKSGWPLAVLLVLTMAITFTAFVASMARATDLLYTGGSFG